MKKVSFFVFGLLSLTLLLQGCVPVIVAAGIGGAAAAGGTVIYDQRSTKTVLDDRFLANSAQAKIDWDQELSSKAHISVVVFNYRVLLVGQAPTAALRDRALNLVNSVPNIKFIQNEVVVTYPTPPATRVSDTWLTTKIKSALLLDKELCRLQIKIVTEDGVVYMMGIVNRQKGDLAAKKAGQVEEVKKVIKLFEYVP